ncbi:putative uncharacterized protein MYH16 isoform X1 [Zingiber officinale]|uniref:C2 NT-type domain-containing protein n=1 Tax=Zingiber officinale TaxID=94328 RepID=A0A8J5KVG7_ZINOF|nr:putative uncharacterized protein MYH16 isoform X1 [Zingiber officinale]KAG6500903.1 hypothetical protein ZIOFF_040765 [Zingiber officinale]
MFKLHRHRSDRLEEKVQFKFSSLQAIKVPRGWDRLMLSIILMESGKVLAKTGKATVRSGNCQWTEAETLWVSQDDASQDLEKCQFRIVVSLASSRSAVLGEIILRLADYLGKEDSGLLFLPLKKCDAGTTLQVKIHCPTPKSKFRITQSWQETNLHSKHQDNIDLLDSKPDGSDHRFNSSVRDPSNQLSNTYPEEPEDMDTYYSASGSHRSTDSGDSFGRTDSSPKNNISGGKYSRRQDSTGSQTSATNSTSPMHELIRSNPSSFNSRTSGSSVHHNMSSWASNDKFTAASLKPSVSSKELVEAAEEIEELNDEVKMWERHSRQLKLDLENLKKELSEKSKHQANLDRQLSAAYSECNSLRLEVEQLKAALQKSTSKDSDIRVVKSEDMLHHAQKELEDELKFQKDTNSNLTHQLRKTQESNIELVSVLQELEEIIEKQRLEIADLSQQNHIDEDEQDENRKSIHNQIAWERELAQKEGEILVLEEKLSNIVKNREQNGNYSDQIREIEVLKAKVNDLEKDCAELTDENLDLIFKLKELSKETVNEPQNIEKKISVDGINEDGLLSLLLLKEQEIARLQQSNSELEDLISIVQDEKSRMEEDLTSLRKECMDTTKHLQDVEHDLQVLTSSIELHSSANKSFERSSMELERNKNELELHVTQLKEENVELSELVSALESQLRYIKNEKESIRMDLEGTSSLADLKNEVEHQKVEMDLQKAELKQKLQETENRLLEVLEESDLLSRSNTKLQVTIESLTEECSTLHKLTEELKRQEIELHRQVTLLKIELDEKRNDFYKQVELLELKIALIQEDTRTKEKSLLSQLKQIVEDHKEHGERIGDTYILLNKIELEKTIEVENLENEIANLTAQKSSNHGDLEKIASDAVQEVSVLRSDKSKLEWNLLEANSKIKLYETDLLNLHQESEDKIAGLVVLLNASKQSEEMLMDDIERIHQAIDSVKYSEEKHRHMENNGELIDKASQVVEGIPMSEVQINKLVHIQNSVLDLKNTFDDANLENRRLEGLLKSLSKEYEELKSEKESLTERVTNMQEAISDSEEDRHNRVVLQEKVLLLENELSLKVASCAQEPELKKELDLMKQTNSEYEIKIQSLEQGNHYLMNKMETAEKELVLQRTSNKEEKEVNHDPEILIEAETEDVDAYRMDQVQLKRVISEKQAGQSNVLDKKVNDNCDRISALETELKEMRERYLHISLQYAQVEAQREELVMQLKSVKREKRWFS